MVSSLNTRALGWSWTFILAWARAGAREDTNDDEPVPCVFGAGQAEAFVAAFVNYVDICV